MSLFMAVIFYTVARSYPKSIGGIREWAAGALGIGIAAPLFVLRDIAPAWLSIVFANTLITASVLSWVMGTRRFLNLPLFSLKPMLIGLCIEVVLLSYWTYSAPNFAARTSMVAGANCLFFILMAWLVWRYAARNAATRFFILIMLLGSASTLLRVVASAMQGNVPSETFLDPTPIQSIYLFFYSLMTLLQAMGFFIMITVSLQRELELDARTDPLTGALNRRALMEQMRAVIATAKRSNQEVSVVAMDLDHFKHINDKFGHDVGDAVLRQFSTMVHGEKRTQDIFARLGGEEFILILPNTSQQKALEVAQRIHRQLNVPETIPGDGLPPYTASFGVSCLAGEKSSNVGDGGIDALFKQADMAVYAAKNAGRNRIEMN